MVLYGIAPSSFLPCSWVQKAVLHAHGTRSRRSRKQSTSPCSACFAIRIYRRIMDGCAVWFTWFFSIFDVDEVA